VSKKIYITPTDSASSSVFAGTSLPVFLINVDASVARMKSAHEQMSRFNVRYTRVSAVTPQTKKANLVRLQISESNKDMSPGALACSASHLKIMQLMVDLGLEMAIICEDDMILIQPLPMTTQQVQDDLIGTTDKDWSVLFINLRSRSEMSETAIGKMIDTKGSCGTDGYIIGSMFFFYFFLLKYKKKSFMKRLNRKKHVQVRKWCR
jgi:GR25 family glycosyltransferase involved in LPS biosynthesis